MHSLPPSRRGRRYSRDERGRAQREVRARRPPTRRNKVVAPPERATVFRRDGSYIIPGGLGGLGLFLAEKMAAAGCGRIVLSSRSEPTVKALETIELVRSIGSDVGGGW